LTAATGATGLALAGLGVALAAAGLGVALAAAGFLDDFVLGIKFQSGNDFRLGERLEALGADRDTENLRALAKMQRPEERLCQNRAEPGPSNQPGRHRK
jgi:small-conductance mechanosensitive channel